MATKHHKTYQSLRSMLDGVDQLPRPAVAKCTDHGDSLAHFRHATTARPDGTYTYGPGRFLVGMSVLGGEALLSDSGYAVNRSCG